MPSGVDKLPLSPSQRVDADTRNSSHDYDASEQAVTRSRGHGVGETSTARGDDTRSKQSLQHILTSTPERVGKVRSQSRSTSRKSPRQETPTKQNLIWVDGHAENVDENASNHNESFSRTNDLNSSNTTTAAHARRNANGTVGSVYSGNKIPHLKKEDGIPLWRKDIQLEFLRCVFEDETPVFTKASDGSTNCSFSEIYVDAMARSGRTSKVLKEKMLADHVGASSMAMICLLVNIGRMNTTLNFFPEMRAQLRTYHAIPSLQAQQDPNSYKQLQDAPRLKSILKAASEDTNQPNTIEKIKAASIPRTNPVNLIFVLSQFAPKISEIHFNAPRDFFDLVMRHTLSSKSRATAFLWLLWWYLESDFSEAAALNNPFGEGQQGDNTGGLPIKVPPFEHLTEEQANLENVDTPEELEFGKAKQQERRRILEEDDLGGPVKRTRKSANGDAAIINISDTERTRSPSPSSVRRPRASLEYHRQNAANSGALENSPSTSRYPPLQSKGDQAHPPRIALKSRVDSSSGPSQPAPPGSSHPVLGSAVSNGYRRSRPETSHQRAVNISRKMRTNHILHKQLMAAQRSIRREKRKFISSFGMLVMTRTQELPDMYDSEEEEGSWGPGGLTANPHEGEAYGEEAVHHRKVLDRAVRRLFREDHGGSLMSGASKADQKRKRKSADLYQIELELTRPPRRRRKEARRAIAPAPPPAPPLKSQKNGTVEPAEEGLDDLDLDLLGENRDDEQYDGDSPAEGSDGHDGDMTEDEVMNEA